MTGNHETADKFDQLRKQAEELIRNRPHFTAQYPSNILDLIHELKLYQAELEIQNKELQRAQKELSELHRECEDLYEFAPCGYLTLNHKGIITRVNLTGTGLLGRERKFLVNSSLHRFIAPGWENAYLSARRMAHETGDKQSVEVLLKREDGSMLWAWLDIEANHTEGGDLLQWRIALTDISRKKEAEKALEESEETFRVLFENAPIAYQTLNENGDVIEVNQAWLDLLGYSQQDVLGRNFSGFILPEVRDRFRQVFLETKSVVKTLGSEFVIVGKSGEQLLVSCLDTTACRKKIKKLLTHCVIWDITAQRKAEEDRKRLDDQLRHAQKMQFLGNLAGGVAHEFNNILSIIINNTELMSMKIPRSSPVTEHVDEIAKAGRHAGEIVQQLLTIGRKDDPGRGQLNPAEVVRDSLKLIRSSMPASIEIKERIPAGISPVFGNATQIRQLMINLCNNAADAMQEDGGVITVELENKHVDEDRAKGFHALKPGQYVVLRVRDTGSGIEKGLIDRIFEPYFTTKKVGKGTGIGLAVAHGIVEYHEGSVCAENEPDQGTVFTVFLPAYREGADEEMQGRAEGKTV